jgi:NNP family nitrate/nitrite transporter-like MFS transporter
MDLRDFRQAGHWPTLLAAFLYFDVSFMAWVLLGPLMPYLAADLKLSVDDKFTLVALPILSGALFRIPLGMLADALGGKKTGILAQLVVILGVCTAAVFGLASQPAIIALGIALGVAGASFAVALPQASRWYPPHYQGIVMGIAGAGNMGVVLDALFIPTLANAYGSVAVLWAILVPLVLVFLAYCLLVKDAPGKPAPMTLESYALLLKDSDPWWFMFFYFITFGGFVGLSSALPLYFTNHYHVSGVTAGLMAACVVLAGSLFRPVGGGLADRFGGIRTLSLLFVVVGLAYFVAAFLPEGPAPESIGTGIGIGKVAGWSLADLPAAGWQAVGVFFVCAMALGMGNGSVFQLVPLRFRGEVGRMTGLIGAMGGLGGFVLTRTLGLSYELTHGFAVGFWCFAGLPVLGLVGLFWVKSRWRTTWGAVSGARV